MAQSASVSEQVVPAGRVSLTTTSAGTVDGPRFLTVIVYVVEVPAVTLPTPSSLLDRKRGVLGNRVGFGGRRFPEKRNVTGGLSMLGALDKTAPPVAAVTAKVSCEDELA